MATLFSDNFETGSFAAATWTRVTNGTLVATAAGAAGALAGTYGVRSTNSSGASSVSDQDFYWAAAAQRVTNKLVYTFLFRWNAWTSGGNNNKNSKTPFMISYDTAGGYGQRQVWLPITGTRQLQLAYTDPAGTDTLVAGTHVGTLNTTYLGRVTFDKRTPGSYTMTFEVTTDLTGATGWTTVGTATDSTAGAAGVASTPLTVSVGVRYAGGFEGGTYSIDLDNYLATDGLATATGVPKMTVISRSQPVNQAGGGATPANAVDTDYGTQWPSPYDASPGQLDIDLSGIPAANRTAMLLKWASDYAYNAGGTVAVLKAYTVQVNAGAGGGASPGSGWVTVATVTGNTLQSNVHAITGGPWNWVRLAVTTTGNAATVNINVDVYDMSAGYDDGLFGHGDSITFECCNELRHQQDNVINGTWPRGNLMQVINARDSTRFPLVLNGGGPGWTAPNGYSNRTNIARSPCKYVVLAFGANDANVAVPITGPQQTTFQTNIVNMLDYINGLGKVPILPTILWAAADPRQTNIATLNTNVITPLYSDATRPWIVRGPDFYTMFLNNPTLLRDGLHPTQTAVQGTANHPDDGAALTGAEWMHRAYRDVLFSRIYNPGGVRQVLFSGGMAALTGGIRG